MGVRNSEEFGINLLKLADRLISNQVLCKLLKSTSIDPLLGPDLKKKDVLHKNIKIVPLVKEEENTIENVVVIIYDSANVNEENTEFDKVYLSVLLYSPLDSWIINNDNLRPFLIISELEKSLKGKSIDGIGKLKYHGWKIEMVSDLICCFRLRFSFDSFN